MARFSLNATILADLFGFRSDDAWRRRRFGFGRFADERRTSPFFLECLAKIARLRIGRPSIDRQSLRTFQINCQPYERAKTRKARGAVPAGQEFVFAN